MNEIENNESLTICGECGGECCLTRPGIESPDRFLSDKDGPAQSIYEALLSGWWVLDTHYGLPPGPNGEKQVPAAEIMIYYPRPATLREREVGTIMGLSDTAPCSYLISNRCLLTFKERPFMCRALEPDQGFECRSGWSRLDAARAWFPLQETVRSVLVRLGNGETFTARTSGGSETSKKL